MMGCVTSNLSSSTKANPGMRTNRVSTHFTHGAVGVAEYGIQYSTSFSWRGDPPRGSQSLTSLQGHCGGAASGRAGCNLRRGRDGFQEK
jgi:hypothetical protein